MIFSDLYFPCFLSCLDWTVHWISFLLFPFITSVLCFVPQMRLRLCLITLAFIFFPSSFAAEAQRISLTAVCCLIASFQLRSKSHRKHFTSIKQTLSASRYFCDTFSSKFSLLLCKTLTYCHEVLNILVFVALYVMKVMSQCKLGFLFFFCFFLDFGVFSCLNLTDQCDFLFVLMLICLMNHSLHDSLWKHRLFIIEYWPEICLEGKHRI